MYRFNNSFLINLIVRKNLRRSAMNDIFIRYTKNLYRYRLLRQSFSHDASKSAKATMLFHGNNPLCVMGSFLYCLRISRFQCSHVQNTHTYTLFLQCQSCLIGMINSLARSNDRKVFAIK